MIYKGYNEKENIMKPTFKDIVLYIKKNPIESMYNVGKGVVFGLIAMACIKYLSEESSQQ